MKKNEKMVLWFLFYVLFILEGLVCFGATIKFLIGGLQNIIELNAWWEMGLKFFIGGAANWAAAFFVHYFGERKGIFEEGSWRIIPFD